MGRIDTYSTASQTLHVLLDLCDTSCIIPRDHTQHPLVWSTVPSLVTPRSSGRLPTTTCVCGACDHLRRSDVVSLIWAGGFGSAAVWNREGDVRRQMIMTT
jgi:hypothetical protein